MDKTRKLVITSLFTAFVCVATMIIKIPVGMGYANLGDAMVLVCAYVLGASWGTFAAAVGSMLADIFSGFTLYAPATLIIKAAVALSAYFIFKTVRKNYIISGVLAEIIMVGGYFLFEAVILGEGTAALTGVAGNSVQGVVSVILSVLLMRIKPLKNIQ